MLNIIAQLRHWLQGRNPLWGLDFDGTLVTLQSEPAQVGLSPTAAETLAGLVAHNQCAIVSGRALEDLRRHVPVPGLHYIANHGGQLYKRDGSSWQWQSADWLHWRETHLKELGALSARNGGWIEDKVLSLALHFQGAANADWWQTHGEQQLRPLMDNSATVLAGAQCWNIVPRGAPDKGQTTLRLCRETGHDSIIYFGDEPTDENVFRIGELPVFGVKVGDGATVAPYRVAAPEQVLAVLNEFI